MSTQHDSLDSRAFLLTDADWIAPDKLTPAELPHPLVPRPALIDQLNVATQKGLTVIATPAGYGKTTALADWLRIQHSTVVWLTLEACDSELIRFWYVVITAFQRVKPQIGGMALRLLQSSPRAFRQAVLLSLLNDLAPITCDITLVLDNYQVVNNAAVHDSLTFLLTHRPPRLHIVIATRVTPPLPLAYLRASGQLAELRSADFAFTAQEATELFRDHLRLPVDVSDVAMLTSRTEGWITGLQLSALALRGHPDPACFIRSFLGNQSMIVDYMVDEVLAHQPADLQSFLYDTALLQSFNASLCTAVTAQNTSQAFLNRIEKSNLFLFAIDTQPGWYRYHTLFAQALQGRMEIERPEKLTTLHRRASDWYAAHAFPEMAIPHALAARAWEQAADLIAPLVHTLWLRGDVTTLLRWLQPLPASLIAARIPLRTARDYALLASGQITAISTVANQGLNSGIAHSKRDSAWSTRDSVPVVSKPVNEHTAIMNLLIATLQDGDAQAIAQQQQTLALQANFHDVEDPTMALNYGFAIWSTGNTASARAMFLRAVGASQRASDRDCELLATNFLAEIAVHEGRLPHAARVYTQMTDLLNRAAAGDTPIAGLPAIGLAGIWFEWNDLERAQRFVDLGIARSTAGGRIDVVLAGLIIQARIQQAVGECDGARRTMEHAIAEAHATHAARLIAYVSGQQAALWLKQGDTIAANDWADTQQLTIDDDLTYLREFEYVTFARVLLARGLHAEALYLLKRIQVNAVADGRNNHVIAVLIATALAHQAHGDTTRAQDAIDQALRLAVSGRYLRSFIDAGPPLVLLLIEAQRRLDRLPQTAPDSGLCLYLDTLRLACYEGASAKKVSKQSDGTP